MATTQEKEIRANELVLRVKQVICPVEELEIQRKKSARQVGETLLRLSHLLKLAGTLYTEIYQEERDNAKANRNS